MSKFGEIFQELVINTLQQTYQFIVNYGPKIALSIIILVIGWICALLLKKITAKLLKALGFDVLLEKTGFKAFLERGGLQKAPSAIVGLIFYWIIIFSALISIFNTLELETASQLINQAVSYIPKITISLVILALGVFLSRFFGKFVLASARLAHIPFHVAIGKTAYYIIVGLTVMVVLEYLGVPQTLVIEYAVIIFGIVPLVICLVFLVGGREIVSNILSGRFLTKEYKIGDCIEFDSISGEIQSIDLISTKIKNKDGKIIVPNAELVKKVIKKV